MKQKIIIQQIVVILTCFFSSYNIHAQKVGIDTLLNSKKYLILGPKEAIVKVAKSLTKYAAFTELARYEDDYILVKNKSSSLDVFRIFRKYSPSKSFNDYKVPVYKGKLALPDFNTNLKAKKFITRIKNECQQGINFAGYYTFISIGCGTACQINFIVNRKTGKIYKSFSSSLGVEFKKTSKLLIKNVGAIDLKTKLIEVCSYCVVSPEVWDGEIFKAKN